MISRAKILKTILIVIILALLVFQAPFLTQARHWTWDWWVAFLAKIGDVGAITVRPDVMGQLQELRSENTRLTAEVKRYQRVQRQLGQSSYHSFRALSAEVAGRPHDTFGAQYFLDRGAADGVTLHAPVVLYGSTLVGFVSELSEHSSVLQMLFHPQTTLPAEVLTGEDEKDPIRGLIQGQHFTSVALTSIPRDQNISPGMVVVTSAQEGLVPYGLVIGSIDTLRGKEQDAYQSASLQLPYLTASLEAVHVLVPITPK